MADKIEVERAELEAIRAEAGKAVDAAGVAGAKAEEAASAANIAGEQADTALHYAGNVVARIDEILAADGGNGGGELPDLIGEWTNVTAPLDLPAGALAGCRLITAAVEFNAPPGTKNEKLVGADSSANDLGGMCMERNTKGLYSVWVQAEGSKVVQLPIAPQVPTFVTFELPDQPAIDATLDEQHGSTPLPRAPDPFDGPACLLAGYWKHQKVDPADAVIYKLRAYRSWSQARIDADREEWRDLFDGGNGGGGNGGGNGGQPPPTGLEQVDPTATQAELIVGTEPQQRYDGFGWTLSSPAAAPKVAELAAKWPAKLFEDLGVRWLGGYGANSAYKAGAALGKKHGITDMFCHGFLYRQGKSAATHADQIKADIDNGIPWTWTCVQSEPDGNPANAWGGYPTDWSRVVADTKALRAALDARGLQHVKIASCTHAHMGDLVDAEHDALDAAGLCPSACAAGGGHFYSDGPTPGNWQRWGRHRPQGMLQTEAGYGDPVNSPARFLSALNNGVAVYLHFEGQAASNEAEALKNGLVDANGVPRPWYASYRLLSPSLPVGTIMRTVTTNNRPQGLSESYARTMVRHRGSSGLVYPKINAAAGKRPDGKWWLGITNACWGSTANTGNLGTHWGAERFQFTIKFGELSGKNGTLTGQRCTAGGMITAPQSWALVDGWTRITLPAGETLALVGSAA